MKKFLSGSFYDKIEIYNSMPEECDILGSNLDDPSLVPQLIKTIGTDKILENINIIINDEEIYIKVNDDILKMLNKNQKWIIMCNLFHRLKNYFGEILDETLKYNVKNEIKIVILYLSEMEVVPGVWELN